MWGLRNQGYRCKGKGIFFFFSSFKSTLSLSLIDCGYNVHKQCRGETSQDCQPSRLLVKRVFSVELTTLVKMHGTKVPVVVSSCIEEVEKRGRQLTTSPDTGSKISLSFLPPGLGLEGLYRVSGMTSEVLKIKKEFDRGEMAEIGCLSTKLSGVGFT